MAAADQPLMLFDGTEGYASQLAAECASAAGHTVNTIIFPGSGLSATAAGVYEIDMEHLKEANRYLMRANKNMHRSWPRRQVTADNGLRRDLYLAKWAHQMYVVGLFVQDASLLKIGTDTAWTAQMYVDRFLYDQEPWPLCELYFFDQKSEAWWRWSQQWTMLSDAPQPDGVYTVIGSERLTNAGKTALRRLYGINQ